MSGQRVLQVVRRAVRERGTEPLHGPGEEGFSGAALMSLLSGLTGVVCDSENAYVEIGVYRGLTLSTVARTTTAPCFGIDNFSLFNEDSGNKAFAQGRLDRESLGHASLIDMDFEHALRSWSSFAGTAQKIGLLFVDGPHDYRSQLMCLLLGRPHLRAGGAIVVDDANYAHVRQASYDFLAAFPDWSLLAEITTPGHPDVVSVPQRVEARQGWWNGVHVLLHDSARTSPRLTVPDTDLSPQVDSHDVFRHRFGPVTLALLEGMQAAAETLPDTTAAQERLGMLLADSLRDCNHRAPSQNTDTSGIFDARIAGDEHP